MQSTKFIIISAHYAQIESIVDKGTIKITPQCSAQFFAIVFSEDLASNMAIEAGNVISSCECGVLKFSPRTIQNEHFLIQKKFTSKDNA